MSAIVVSTPFSLLPFPRAKAREKVNFPGIYPSTPIYPVFAPMSDDDSTPVSIINEFDVGNGGDDDTNRSKPEHDDPRESHSTPAPPKSPFDEYAFPTSTDLQYAAALCVLSETGQRVPFGTLCKFQKTIVCFIRHFMCPLCQDYMFSISRNICPKILRDAGVNLVIISNGAWEMIKSYRKIFRTPYAIYTDPYSSLYAALGMHLRTLDPGPPVARGGYVRHGLLGGIGMVMKNAVKTKMPVWKYMGDKALLGGEFVFAPGEELKCIFAHRMRYTQNHISILKVVSKAGVNLYAPLEKLRIEKSHSVQSATSITTDPAGLNFVSFLGMTKTEEIAWMEKRRQELWVLHEKKRRRRLGLGNIPLHRKTGLASVIVSDEEHGCGLNRMNRVQEDQREDWEEADWEEAKGDGQYGQCTFPKYLKKEEDMVIAGQVLEEILYSHSLSRSCFSLVDSDLAPDLFLQQTYWRSTSPSPLFPGFEEYQMKESGHQLLRAPASLYSSPAYDSNPET